MFSDLVGSTALSEQLDIEDMSALLRAYREAAGAVVARYDGHIAQYLGDGLMIYFGWPRAHEDDVARAVHAGLAIVAAVARVPAPAPLEVRIGIATGPVVVGTSGSGDAAMPTLAVGETPNLAAMVQGEARAGEVVLADATRRLAGGAFDCDDRGEAVLKGIVEPVRVWRVIGESRASGRFHAASPDPTAAIIGRQAEVALLMDRWQMALDGEGQVMVMSG